MIKMEKIMSKDFGKVSIIVPVYNVEKYFDKCIESILSQTYKNIEIIIVDDGTKDNCGRKADEYAKADSRITVFHKENGGLSSARNYGLKYATGDYFCFVDSDDYLSEEYIEKMMDVAFAKEADMIICNYYNCYVNRNRPSSKLLKYDQIKKFTSEEFLDRLYCYPGSFSYVWNKLYRRDLFRDIEFADMLCEDSQIMLSLADRSKIIYLIPNILYYYRRRKSSIINGKQEIILYNEMKWLENHMERLKASNREHLFSMAQKLYISKILEKYSHCQKKTQKELKHIVRKEMKSFKKNKEIKVIVRLKYYFASLIPGIYGRYFLSKTQDKDTFWD